MHTIDIEIYADQYKRDVASLVVNIQNAEFGIPITLEMQPDLLDIPRFYQVKNGNFWVARDGKEIIGTIALLDIGNKQGALRKMFVHKDFRGKEFGVGQKLLSMLLDWARLKSVETIFLGTTAKFIGAQRFYEKNGFQEIKKEHLPTSFPVMEVDVRFYQRAV
ncbi:MAG: GNAT family N-acetyltransferase [Ferruginibacter sp.]